MTARMLVSLLPALLPPVICSPAAAASAWTALSDGHSLAGWQVACKPSDRGKEFWSVRDGAITCDSRGRKDHDYVWLIHEKEFGDFELELEVRAFRDSTGNSGIQFRSRYDESASWLHGPQVDIHPPAPWRCGLIYDETRETRRWIYPSLPNARIEQSQGAKQWKWKYSDEEDGWNRIHIRAAGTLVKTTVNGHVVTDADLKGILDDDAHRLHKVGLRGHFALQLHSRDELLIQYRKIRVRQLAAPAQHRESVPPDQSW